MVVASRSSGQGGQRGQRVLSGYGCPGLFEEDDVATVVFDRAAFVDALECEHRRSECRRERRERRARRAGGVARRPAHAGVWCALVVLGNAIVLAMIIIAVTWN
ncbi:hypothetical protein FVA95_25260 [Pseudonocardia sp. EV170527-09]|uniref:hypothetical protein n=1 Tax=Pseudonocardia sp. EV170527-09 TaxID=2603411 RepID=UPI0011F30E47|nr:hypothetical protein [Pseudonocardia sp. EV170527-09]KAA1016825.1 hypothetical protein FVA95_25260 [Pseudonocardia sp. EV170527-09]